MSFHRIGNDDLPFTWWRCAACSGSFCMPYRSIIFPMACPDCGRKAGEILDLIEYLEKNSPSENHSI